VSSIRPVGGYALNSQRDARMWQSENHPRRIGKTVLLRETDTIVSTGLTGGILVEN